MGVVKENRFDRVVGLVHKIDELNNMSNRLSKMERNVLASDKKMVISTNSADISISGANALDVIRYISSKIQSESSLLKNELESYMKD